MKLTAKDAYLGYGEAKVVKGVSLAIDPAQITVIIGPNGSGKSTLLSGLAGQLPLQHGEIWLGDRSVTRWTRRALARKLALLPQQPQAPEDILVRQMVSHGRFAHRKPFARLTKEDHAHIDLALQQTSITELADRPVDALSGGQRQRVWIAMALVQAPHLLLLDEPTSFLDLGFQHQVLWLLQRLNREGGLGILMVLHDINQASFYADRIVALKDGEIVADGAPEDVVVPEIVEHLYGINVRAERSAVTKRPYCVPAYL